MATEGQLVAARASSDLLEKARRWGMYAAWLGLASALPLATDRLVIAPHVNATLGPTIFGAFLFVQGFFLVAGNILANGLSIVVLREYSDQPLERAPRMLRTGMSLTALGAFLLLPATAYLAHKVAPPGVRLQAVPLFTCLPLVAALRSMDLMLINMLRINRTFGRIVVLKALEALVLLLLLWTRREFDIWFVCGVYLASAMTSFAVNLAFHREFLWGGGWWDLPYVKALLWGSLAGAMMTLFDQMQVHLARLVLGITLSDLSAIPTLFAATSIGNLFVLPMILLGTCLLSMLAGQRRLTFHGKRFAGFAGSAVTAALAVGTSTYVVGPLIVARLYPELAVEVESFFGWIAAAGAGMTIVALMRPIVIKFGKLRSAMWLSALAVLLQVGGLPWATSHFGVTGAAAMLAIAALASGLAWLACAFTVSRQAASADEEGKLRAALE